MSARKLDATANDDASSIADATRRPLETRCCVRFISICVNRRYFCDSSEPMLVLTVDMDFRTPFWVRNRRPIRPTTAGAVPRGGAAVVDADTARGMPPAAHQRI